MQAIDTPSARAPSTFYWIRLILVPVVFLAVMTIVARLLGVLWIIGGACVLAYDKHRSGHLEG